MNKKIIVLLNLSIIVFIVGIFTWRFWSKKPTPTIEIPPDLEIVLTTKGTYYPRETILQIKADGSVYYKDRFYAGPKGLEDKILLEKRGKISESELKEILKVFYDNNFFSLDNFYTHPDVLDAGFTIVSINLAGKHHKVSSYAGAGPQSFHNIAEKLFSVRDKIIAIPGDR